MNLKKLILEREYTVILTLGDSIAEANHCSEGHPGYVSGLDEALRLTCGKNRYLLINAAIGGGRLCESISFLSSLITRFSPDVTTVMYGMNDCTTGIDGLEPFGAALTSLIAVIRKRNSVPVLMTSNPIDYRCDIEMIQQRQALPAYMGKIRTCSQVTCTELIDINDAWQKDILDVSNNEHFKLMHDGIHPNQHGHRYILDQIKMQLF